jgi:hypothetical protein
MNEMFDDDIDIDYDLACPHCDHSPLRSRSCNNIHCVDGSIDEFEDDPINFPAEGESFHLCRDCKGTGIERWCPSCGKDLSGHEFPDDEIDEPI